jgi:hypothetical protein
MDFAQEGVLIADFAELALAIVRVAERIDYVQILAAGHKR